MNPLTSIDHGPGEPFHLLAVHIVDVGSCDVSCQLDLAEVIIYYILHDGSDLILSQLLLVHHALDIAK